MQFKEMDEFVYLGVRITCKCEEEKEIEAKLSKVNRCARRLNHLLGMKQFVYKCKAKNT